MTTATTRHVDSLAAIVGPANVRAGRAPDRLCGLAPGVVVAPGTETEAAEVLRACSRAGLRVVIRGAGSKLTWGAPPSACDVVLSTRHLDALVAHEPGDLVCVAQAGMTLAALQDALAQAEGHRQRLMLDPPAGGTLGGIVATAACGPLRTRYGTPRDLLIGVRFVLADGTIGHAGGKVVKNVAGYDLGKLLTGSQGTLALVTQVAFRLHPLPAASETVLYEDRSPSRIAGFLDRLRVLPMVPACVDVLWPDGLVRVRIDASPEGARRQAERVAGEAGGRLLPAAEAEALDAEVAVRPWSGRGAIAGVAIPRTAVARLLDLASEHVEELVLRGLLGTGEARLREDAAAVSAWRSAVAARGGHVVLRRSPPALGALAWPHGDVVAEALMRAVKHALDPAGMLASGRMGALQ